MLIFSLYVWVLIKYNHDFITMNKQLRTDDTPVCINSLTVDNPAPGHTVVSAQESQSTATSHGFHYAAIDWL